LQTYSLRLLVNKPFVHFHQLVKFVFSHSDKLATLKRYLEVWKSPSNTPFKSRRQPGESFARKQGGGKA
jgi:hypothetical protein